MKTGGLSDVKLINEENEINDLVENIKNQFEKLIGNKIHTISAISYRTQVVNGTNYFIKVLVNENQYVHLKIYEALSHEKIQPKLINYELNKTKIDEIKYI